MSTRLLIKKTWGQSWGVHQTIVTEMCLGDQGVTKTGVHESHKVNNDIS